MVYQTQLWQLFSKSIQQLYGLDIPQKAFSLQPTTQDFQGTHTIVLFPLLPFCKKPIAELGKSLGNFLVQEGTLVTSFHVVNGFLNLTLSDSAWCEALREYIAKDLPVEKPKKIIVEISCPNTNKPLHLGHLRNVFLGDAMANILGFVGHDVQKINHVNDRGIHICKSMYAYQQDPQASTPEAQHKKGDHYVGDYYVRFDKQYKKEIATLTPSLGEEEAKKQAPSMLGVQHMLRAWENGDVTVHALWKKMNDWVYAGFDETYRYLGITFDKSYYESSVYLLGKKVVMEGLEKKVFYKKQDGSIWVDLTEEGLGHKLLLRADGTAVYITQDLGTADLRYQDFGFDRSIYVVGDEQAYHFAVLFAVLKKLGRPYAQNLFHLAYGMIDLPGGKMKSREGTVVDADTMIEEMMMIAQKQTLDLGKVDHFSNQELQKLYKVLAIGALKFFLLKVSPQKRMCFDPQKSIDFLGCTATFIQYCYARIATLLRKASDLEMNYHENIPKTMTLDPLEKSLIIQLVRLRDVLYEATDTLNPSLCAYYLYDLAKSYNQLYTHLPILRASDKVGAWRLYLSWCTKTNLFIFATILGIQLPEKM